ncbi:MAG: helicase-exonuclease AddAB subunit AddB [Clostridia bacterium]|nr:helicase-exonuclease AddAB subunit AddB [Clostridia bacterium]
MSLRFIVGRAGTGKTRYCLDRFMEEQYQKPRGSPLILLVPEQATFQLEHKLLHSGMEGMMRGQVLSFRRLAYRVFQEVGGLDHHIDDVGKKIILRLILQKRKEELEIFSESHSERGFIENLSGLLTELHAYNITPGDLTKGVDILEGKAKGGRDNILGAKLRDLSMIYKEMALYLQDKYTDPDDYLSLLAKSIKDSRFLMGANIWVDGFAGFTPQEYEVLGELMKTAARVEVALCLDGRNLSKALSEEELFYRCQETYEKLMLLGEKNGVIVEKPLILDDIEGESPPRRFSKNPDLAYLERGLYNFSVEPFEDVPDNIGITAAANRRVEVEWVAREIIRLCRDEGYRWRDISVVLRNLEPYQEVLIDVFESHDIPYFMDRKKQLTHHPLVRLILAVVQIVISGWEQELVMGYLKNPLVPIDQDMVDHIENFVLEKGVTGRKSWIEQDWKNEGFSASLYSQGKVGGKKDNFNTCKKVFAILDKFYLNFLKSKNTEDMTVTLFRFLEDLKVAETMTIWQSESAEGQQLQKIQEHSQTWNGLLDLLDQMVEIMGNEILTPHQYEEILGAGLESIRLRLIPPSMDEVFIASIERSRHPDVKAAFVIGMNESLFPATIAEETIFNDEERKLLKGRMELDLAPTSRTRLLQEQFLVYVALTRSSHKLNVSYSFSDNEGRAMSPSMVITRLMELFPAVEEKQVFNEPRGSEQMEYICHRGGVLRTLLRKIRAGRGVRSLETPWIETMKWFYWQDGWDQCKKILSSIYYKNIETPLDSNLVQGLYGSYLKASVSSLERFASCPFAYFLERALKLQPREEYCFAPRHRGTFFHNALRDFTELLSREGLDWGHLDEDKAVDMVEKIAEKRLKEIRQDLSECSPGFVYQAKESVDTLKKAVRILSYHAQHGSFKPYEAELSFGMKGDTLPPLKVNIENDRQLVLRGRIDRVDVLEHGGCTYIKIIDYKSRIEQFRLRNFYNGVSIQLLSYMALLIKEGGELFGPEVLPAAVLYFAVMNPIVNLGGPLEKEKIESKVRQELKMTGLLLEDLDILRFMDGVSHRYSEIIPVQFTKSGVSKNSNTVLLEQFKYLLDFVEVKLAQLGNEIYSGEVSISPYRDGNFTPCAYCGYRSVCGFDSFLGNSFRVLGRESDREILEKIYQELSVNNEE